MPRRRVSRGGSQLVPFGGAGIAAAAEGAPEDREGEVDEDLVERAVRELHGLVVGGQIDLVVAVGEYLLKRFYGGSVDEARALRPRKAASLRRLAERAEEFGMTATGVRTAVPMALQVRAIGVGLARRLPMTHHLEILPLKDPAEKRLLAEAAVASAWTVRDLRRERGRLQEPHPGGRPPEPALRIAVGRAARLLVGDKVPTAELRRGLDGVAAKEARQLLRQVEAMQRELERWEKLLVEAVGRGAPVGDA